MEKTIYTPAFKEQALIKLYSRGSRTVRAVAEELQMNYSTAKNWMKAANKQKKIRHRVVNAPEKRPQDWTLPEQLSALHATHGLTETEISAWCRGHGLFPHHLSEWEASFCKTPVPAPSAAAEAREIKTLKADIARLKREAERKDKALAEAAALLILQKKFSALWEGEDE